MLGVDYAGGRPGGAALKAAGYGFACRYLSSGGLDLPGKLLLPEEAADLLANGVDVVSNWETTSTTMLGGTPQGRADAVAAQAQHVLCGGPADRPIYFSADWDARGPELNQISAYLVAAAGVLGGVHRVGIYGSCSVVDWCLANGYATWGWQTDAWSWNQTEQQYNRSPGAHIHQRIQQDTVSGIAVDVNESITADFGQWKAALLLIEDDDMKMIQSAGRGIAVVGPGYYRQLGSDEEVIAAGALCTGPVLIGSDHDFDLRVSISGGNVAQATLDAANNAAGISSEVRNLIVDQVRGVLHEISLIPTAVGTAVGTAPGPVSAPVDLTAITAAAAAGANSGASAAVKNITLTVKGV